MSQERRTLDSVKHSDTQLFMSPIVTLGPTITAGNFNGAFVKLEYDFDSKMVIVTASKGGASKEAWLPVQAVHYMVPALTPK